MNSLRTQITTLKAQLSQDQQFLTEQEFLSLFKILYSYTGLDDDALLSVFYSSNSLDEGKISRQSVEKLLDTVLAHQEENSEEPRSFPQDRASICLKAQLRVSLNPKARFSIRSSRLNSENYLQLLNTLTFNKINEIKEIYSRCEGSKGYVTLDQIVTTFNQNEGFEIALEDMIELFMLLKEEGTDMIMKKDFTQATTDAEQLILKQHMNEQAEQTGRERLMSSEGGKDAYNATLMTLSSNNPKYIVSVHQRGPEQSYDKHLGGDILMVIEKTKAIINEMKNKTKVNNLTMQLNEVISILLHLTKRIEQNDEKFMSLEQITQERRRKEWSLVGKVTVLEEELQYRVDTILNLGVENDLLHEANLNLDSFKQMYEGVKKDLDERNNEIVRLERRFREERKRDNELQLKMKDMEDENKILLRNYKELEELLTSMKEEESQVEGTNQDSRSNSSLYEMGTLQIELQTALEQKKKAEKQNSELRRDCDELQEEILNKNEFIDGLRLERDGLKSRLNKLQQVFDTQLAENTSRRTLFRNTLMRATRHKENLGDLMKLEQILTLTKAASICYIPAERAPEPPKSECESEHKEQLEQEKDSIAAKGRAEAKDFRSLMLAPSLPVTLEVHEKSDEEDDDDNFSMFNDNSDDTDEEEDKELIGVQQRYAQSMLNILSYNGNRQSASEATSKDSSSLAADLVNMRQDYLSLRKKPQVVRLLKKKEGDHADISCFSDSISVIDSKKKRRRVVLLITSVALYFLAPKRNLKMLKQIQIERIYSITLSKESIGLCAIHVRDDCDYLIDTYRSQSLVSFLQSVFRQRDIKPFSVLYNQSILTKGKRLVSFQEIESSKAVVASQFQSVYRSANKVGELYREESPFGISIWKRYRFILTDVGLVCLKTGVDTRPVEIIPVVGLELKEEEEVKNGKYSFKLKYPFSNFEVILAAKSEIAKKEWTEAIREIQEKAVKSDLKA